MSNVKEHILGDLLCCAVQIYVVKSIAHKKCIRRPPGLVNAV